MTFALFPLLLLLLLPEGSLVPSSVPWFEPSAAPGPLLLHKQSNWVLRCTSDLGCTQPLTESVTQDVYRVVGGAGVVDCGNAKAGHSQAVRKAFMWSRKVVMGVFPSHRASVGSALVVMFRPQILQLNQ